MRNSSLRGALLTAALIGAGCGNSSTPDNTGSGGNNGVGGASASGGAGAVGGLSSATGGKTSSNSTQAAAGGSSATATTTGGKSATTGGKSATTGGGTSKGGTSAVATTSPTAGGTIGSGGATGAGGKAVGGGSTNPKATGGAIGDGGASAAGGAATGIGGKSAGGAGTATGGNASVGGTSTAGGSGSGITVQLDKTNQTIQGFGINDTWADSALPAKLFSTTDADGLGLSILRVGLGDNGKDFSSNIPGDVTMAKAAGAKVIGSCWSPPANCKTNNNVNDGGHLLESCYGSWSDTIVKWAKGHGLYAMSIGNEPDFASCGMNEPCNGNYPTTLFTAKEMVAWVKVAGPKLQKEGIKVIAPEASEWIHNWSNISGTGSEPSNKNSSDPLKCGCFANVIDAATEAKCSANCASGGGYDYGHWLAKDEAAWSAFDIMGVHEYDTQRAEPWPADVTDGKITKELWQTEMSGVKWWPEQGTISNGTVTGTTHIENGVAVAGWIHSALVVGKVSAWLYWWYKPLGTDDNEGLLVKKDNAVAKRYYTFGNYSKFVRPGQIMVDVTGNSDSNLLISAFKGASDGSVVVVAINKGTAAATVPITIAGGTAPASCTPYVTSSSDNLKAGTAVSVTNGTFSASLGKTTVTTFVCKG